MDESGEIVFTKDEDWNSVRIIQEIQDADGGTKVIQVIGHTQQNHEQTVSTSTEEVPMEVGE